MCKLLNLIQLRKVQSSRCRQLPVTNISRYVFWKQQQQKTNTTTIITTNKQTKTRQSNQKTCICVFGKPAISCLTKNNCQWLAVRLLSRDVVASLRAVERVYSHLWHMNLICIRAEVYRMLRNKQYTSVWLDDLCWAPVETFCDLRRVVSVCLSVCLSYLHTYPLLSHSLSCPRSPFFHLSHWIYIIVLYSL